LSNSPVKECRDYPGRRNRWIDDNPQKFSTFRGNLFQVMYFVVEFLLDYIRVIDGIVNPVILNQPLMHHGFCMKGKNQETGHDILLSYHVICITVIPRVQPAHGSFIGSSD